MIRISAVSFLLLVAMLSAGASYGQTEIERERASLRGASDFPVVVDIEGPPRIERERETNVRGLKNAVEARLEQARIPVRLRPGGRDLNRQYLYLHVNILETSGVTHPFSIELGMYQTVELERDRRIALPARTWHASAVGYLSGDVIVGIRDAALSLVEEFIDDFVRANSPQ